MIPDEYLAVKPNQGVPPSLILPLSYLLNTDSRWINDLYPGFVAWFKWYDVVL